MKFFASAFVLMALATSQAIAAPTVEATDSDLETRADYCATVKICHGYKWGGGCYKECKRPNKIHYIKKDYRGNIGSIKLGTKGYTCNFGPNGEEGGNDSTLVVKYPGTKRIPDGWVNNLKAYQCNKNS